LESSKETVQKAVESVEARVKEVSEAFDTKASELEKSLTELSEKFDSIRTEREEVTKRLEVLEKSTAIKKSGEVEAAPETKVQKGIWGGALFSRED
jgi:chromosome segregation ATPase